MYDVFQGDINSLYFPSFLPVPPNSTLRATAQSLIGKLIKILWDAQHRDLQRQQPGITFNQSSSNHSNLKQSHNLVCS